MQPVKTGNVQSAINVTPLVDVVLVLLIIFMVVAPQLASGPDVRLPTTEQPPENTGDGNQILIAIERSGTIWVDNTPVTDDDFARSMLDLSAVKADHRVVIKGDARLTYGEVKQAMLAVEAAGFKDVGLVAERREDAAIED